MKKRIELSELGLTSNHATHIEVQIYYALGGMNYFSYKVEPRGYWMSVTPVIVSTNFVQFSAFSGTKCLLLETKRKSDKAYKQAITLCTPELEKQLITRVTQGMAKKDARKEIEKKIGISIPPKFDGMTEAEITCMTVQVVTSQGTINYSSLAEAREYHDLNEFYGAMYGEVFGRPALRFESQEMNKLLSA